MHVKLCEFVTFKSVWISYRSGQLLWPSSRSCFYEGFITNLMFLPCIVVDNYIKTNVMHFLLSLLRVKGLYMFRALLAHLLVVLHKRHLYCVCVMSDGCARCRCFLLQPTDIIRTHASHSDLIGFEKTILIYNKENQTNIEIKKISF
jgi:hypothetical protein